MLRQAEHGDSQSCHAGFLAHALRQTQDEEVGVPRYISAEDAAAAAAAAAQGAVASGGEAAAAAACALADMMGGGLDANAAAIANAALRARPAWMAGDAAAFTGDQASEVLSCHDALRTRYCQGILVGGLEAIAMDSAMAVLGLHHGSMQPRSSAASHD